MDFDKLHQELKKREGSLNGILKRFNKSSKGGWHIQSEDGNLLNKIVYELKDLFEYDLRKDDYAINVVHFHNEGMQNFTNSPSHASVGRIRDLTSAAITWVENHPDNFKVTKGGKNKKERSKKPMISKKIFIAHGKDYRLKNSAAKFLIDIKLKPIILHRQASKGKTVIEKIEKHSDVSFAVVLLTPDDIGGPDKKKNSIKYLKPRARQNVILELGYFMGKLGRNKVAVIYKKGVEIPSDYSGVIFIPFDRRWKEQLAKEIRASGIDIDLNKLSIKLKERINKEIEEGNKLLQHYEERKKTILTPGNLKREIWIMLGNKNNPNNIEQIEVNRIEYLHKSGTYYEGVDGNTVPTVKEQKSCRRTNLNAKTVSVGDAVHKNRYIYFRVDRKFIDENERNLKILIEYLDEKEANWSLEYQSTDRTATGEGDYKKIPFEKKRNDNQWHKAELILHDAKFAKGQNGKTDFRIKALHEKDIHIHKITVIPV